MEAGDYFTAFELTILCFSPAFDAIEYIDAYSGDVKYAREERLEFISRSIEEG